MKTNYRKFGTGDIVKIRNKEIARVVMSIEDEDGSIWYEVESVGFQAPFNREVRQEDLTMA